MATPFLALNTSSGAAATAQVYRYTNCTAAPLGVTIAATSTDNTRQTAHTGQKHVVQFGGANTFLALLGAKIYRSTDAGASWSSVHDFTATVASTNNALKSGLHIIYVGGVPVICAIYWSTTTTTWRSVRSYDGVTWTGEGAFTVGGISTAWVVSDELVFNGSIWLFLTQNGTGAKILIYSPTSSALSELQVTTPYFPALPDGYVGTFAVFDGRLMCLYRRNTYVVELVELVASVAVSRGTTASAGTPAAAGQRDAMFVDGAYLYTMYRSSTGAWVCYQFDASFNQVNVSSSVIPSPINTTSLNTSRMEVYVDHEASIGSASPTIYLYYAVNNTIGTGMTMYQWNGPASVMTVADSGGDVGHYLGITRGQEGGEYGWTSGENAVVITSVAPLVDKERISFKLYSPSGSASVNVRGWCGPSSDEYPSTAMIFSDPQLPATLSGNTVITNLTADNTTTYQVTWEAGSGGNGFSAGDRVKSKLEVY